MNGEDLPAVTGSLAIGTDGHVYLALVNMDPTEDADIDLNLDGKVNKTLSGSILTADIITAKNTFDDQHSLEPEPFKARADKLVLPAKSVVVLTLN